MNRADSIYELEAKCRDWIILTPEEQMEIKQAANQNIEASKCVIEACEADLMRSVSILDRRA